MFSKFISSQIFKFIRLKEIKVNQVKKVLKIKLMMLLKFDYLKI